MPFRDAPPHRTLGPRDFGAFSSLLLAEHRDKDDSPSARALLSPLYACFTEGFATRDLQAAQVLLDDLG